MRFPPEFLQELRDRLPVSEVVGRRVKLKKTGREWKGLSPFNKERTPSFTVNDQKGFFHDFSSGKHGDIFGFVMETEGLSFSEAVERLAAMAGVPVPKVSRETEEAQARRRTLHEIVELAAQYFAATLVSRMGAKARGYLADRGIDTGTQLKFRLGYALPERFALKEHLGKQGVSVADMVEAGLLIAGEDIPVPYDRFRDRVIFPITDGGGRVIAFGGRALEKDVPAKYLNSPETPLFHKGANLYNFAPARAAAHGGSQVIAVEGYVDVIAMVGAGFDAAVAPLGTALTADQLGLLWKMADEPILCFDGDGAGRRAAYRSVDLALPLLLPGKSVKFAALPEGQDPDDLVRSGGRGAVAEVLGQALPLADMLWARETEAGGFDTPERRAALEAKLNGIIGSIGHEAVRKYYWQDFGDRIRRLFAPAPAAARQARGQPGRGAADRRGGGRGRAYGRASEPLAPPLVPGQAYSVVSAQLAAGPIHRGHRLTVPRREALILQLVVNHPALLHDHLEELSELEFRHKDTELLKGTLIDLFAHDGPTDRGALRGALEALGLGEVVDRITGTITTASVWGTRPEAGSEDVLLTWRQLVALHRQWHSLSKELRAAEQALGQESTEANYSWLRDVKNRLSAIDGTEALVDGFGAASGRPARSW
jgi:DNA primase